MGSHLSSENLPPVLQLRPYQQRWIDDDSRFKLAVKSARIGFSFGTAVEVVLDCLMHPGTTWTVLSASGDQSKEFIEEHVSKIVEAFGAVAQIFNEPFADELGATDILAHRANLPGGSRIIALKANPRTARGYPGNAVLDEFAHHEHSYQIWAAVSRQIALGHKIRILSTPLGQQGKFYDLAREFKLTEGVAPNPNPVRQGPWSCHWVDVHMAIADGLPINLQETRALYKGDDDTYAQEFLCAFLNAIDPWLPLELISRAEHAGATIDWPVGYLPTGRLSLGIDVGRTGDRTNAWMDEEIGDVSWCRMVLRLHDVPFHTPDKKNDQSHILLPWVQMAHRSAMDSTGLGLGLFEFLSSECPGRVMGVNFSGVVPKGDDVPAAYQSRSGNVKIKTDLAVRLKQKFEQGKNRIPQDLQIRQELQAVKKEYSGGAIKFDAPRIEIDTPGGGKKKMYAHADAFWAKAMADLAAAGAPDPAFAGTTEQEELAMAAASRGGPRGLMARSFAELTRRENPGAYEDQVELAGPGRRSLWS